MLIRSRAVLSFVLLLLLVQTLAPAEDGAHGGATGDATTNANKPGQAVKAPRTTERYSEKGVTVDPVAIDIAPNGDIYVAEGSRAGKGVIDNRDSGLRKSNGVINDLQKTSVEDRLEQIKMLTEGGFYPPDTFTKNADRVRLVKDTDGDGKADASSIFADNFNEPLDGIASGVLYHEGKVYLTNIPHLWLLEDKDGDGDADKTTGGERTSLSYGYGIRWAFYGHDMHGLIKGPDGRIYFSIGDRGYNVTTKEGKHLYGPDRGAVFRMWPDGSGLEVYFEGLRNPQELAFDNYGNLFTGDNNSDAGDKARFAYLPEGGDAGWRQDVQSLKDRGPWNREFMWHPRKPKDDLSQPAWIIPPLANVGRGPSGLTHYPGTGDVFPSNGSFLMCDYPAGVRHVHVKPDGAMFKVVEDSKLPTEGSTITDVTWGYDGRLYLSDWGGGWKPNPNGYIKTMINAKAHEEQAKVIAEVKALFADGFENLGDGKLLELLGHQDQRVRLNAQWEITERPVEERLWGILTDYDQPEFVRLHALWAFGMKALNDPINEVFQIIPTALNDPSPNVRAQAARILGELKFEPSALDIDELLLDSSAIVQYHAAIALGKVGSDNNIGSLLDLLDINNNDDVAIRHAASYGLSLIGDAEEIVIQMKRRGSAARLGAVLALRHLDSPLLADFLNDEDPMVAAEAARAIYDKRVMDAMPALAALSDTLPADRMSEPVMRRVIEANVRLADQASATRLARLAANPNAPKAWRLLALTELDGWGKPRDREGVWGAWWPRETQSMAEAMSAVLSNFDTILANTQGKAQDLARSIVINQYTVDEIESLALNTEESPGLRAGAANALIDKDRSKGEQAAKAILAEQGTRPELLIPVRALLLPIDQAAAIASYLDAYESGELIEQQDAIRKLGPLKHEKAQALIASLAPQLVKGELPASLRLDVFEVLEQNKHLPPEIRIAATQYKQQHSIQTESPFIRDAVTTGGSVERGKEVFFHHQGAGCTQCHRLDNEESQGPNLSGIGAARDMDYLYTSVVLPNADILSGYVNENNQSNMKPMNEVLSPMELRDVLAYLASLKSDPGPAYQMVNATGSNSTGPQVVQAASKWNHALLLPLTLLIIGASLVALLLLTVLGARRASITSAAYQGADPQQ
ncbi:MAG: HEAT repeat domain-containing protein [Phycisphaeraceae bacterium]|nr:HEAT repeat domain-containing protein [Phycisphaeraceae bacterium]